MANAEYLEISVGSPSMRRTSWWLASLWASCWRMATYKGAAQFLPRVLKIAITEDWVAGAKKYGGAPHDAQRPSLTLHYSVYVYTEPASRHMQGAKPRVLLKKE